MSDDFRCTPDSCRLAAPPKSAGLGHKRALSSIPSRRCPRAAPALLPVRAFGYAAWHVGILSRFSDTPPWGVISYSLQPSESCSIASRPTAFGGAMGRNTGQVSHTILAKAAKLRLFGKHPAWFFLRLNRQIWEIIPADVRNFYLIPAYWAWLQSL